MAALIDSTYFIDELQLEIGRENATSIFPAFLLRMQEVYFRSYFGYGFYKTMIAGYESDEQIWKDFIKGSEYYDEAGDLQKWDGIINDLKRSSLASFCFTIWVSSRYQDILSSSGSATVNNGEGVDNVPPTARIIVAFNLFNKQTQDAYNYLDATEMPVQYKRQRLMEKSFFGVDLDL